MKITNLIMAALVLVSANAAFATDCKAKVTNSLFANSNPTAVVKKVQTTSTAAAVR